MVEAKVILQMAEYNNLMKEKEWREKADHDLLELKKGIAETIAWYLNTKADPDLLIKDIYNQMEQDHICYRCGSDGSVPFKDPAEDAGREHICLDCLKEEAGQDVK